ncbi:MAG: type II toxin-antitoxin system MqsA family antitoxin [Verrucomicrobiae bacterium]|nr:type II toxin-antitoxin system MqsA family antitoxin [Verrucomicrobiae bacterium]
MGHQYSDCYQCGGEVKERSVAREIWWKSKLHLIENVPVGVCQQCGEKVILPDVAKVIDQMLAGEHSPRSLRASAHLSVSRDRACEVPRSVTRSREPFLEMGSTGVSACVRKG